MAFFNTVDAAVSIVRSAADPKVHTVDVIPNGRGFVYVEVIVDQPASARVEATWGGWTGSTGTGAFSRFLLVTIPAAANAVGDAVARTFSGPSHWFGGPDIVRQINETKFLAELEDESGDRATLTLLGVGARIGRVWFSFGGKADWLQDVDANFRMAILPLS
jgi:hypothetical protein